ncbi:MAG: hypothetical protein AAGI69_28910 [Cyanobacteria bacterium P01_H01_bin.21]
MGLPIIVEIAIGLAFIYLVLSLLASEIQELIATVLQWRAKHLKDSIINLFTGDIHSTHSIQKAQQLTKQVYQHPLVQGMNQESMGRVPNLFRKFTWFISNAYRRIIRKEEGEFNDQRTAPSYISREAFATALLEQLGTKHFVERLVEAKFSKFIDTINEKIENSQKNTQDLSVEYKNSCKKKIKEIESEFKGKKIDLKSAISSVSYNLDKFLESQNSNDSETTREELREWKSRFFVEEGSRASDAEAKGITINTEQIIETFGLKPNLGEIVESIDKGSKIYNTYKEKFQEYEKNRFNSVHEDLNQFENFLSRFLKELVKEFYQDGVEVLSKKHLHKIDALDTEFFIPLDSKEGPEFRRTRRPLSEINEVILEKLKSCLRDIERFERDENTTGSGNGQDSEVTAQMPVSNSLADNNSADKQTSRIASQTSSSAISDPTNMNGEKLQSPQKLKDSLRAFIDGFEGKTNLFYPQDILWPKSLWPKSAFQCKVYSLALYFGLGILIVSFLAEPSMLGGLSRKGQQFLLHPWGGSISLLLLVAIPGVIYWLLNKRQSDQKKESQLRRAQVLELQVKDDGDLQLMSLERVEELPSEGEQVVIIAKINNHYYVRSFDESKQKVLDKGPDKFLPDTKLTQELETAFSRGESLTKDEKEELARKITSSLGLDSRKSLAGIFDDYFANEAFNKNALEGFPESQDKVSQENSKEGDLQLMSLERIEKLPSEDKQVIIVAKIDNAYCVRSFDESGEIVLDKKLGEFLPDVELTQELEAAFSRGESLKKEEKEVLARKIISEIRLQKVKQKLKQFSQEISQRLQQISEEPSDLYAEMRDLGRSFRRYYLRFLLENADIDLAFIPSSVKQSLAVLVRRSKTSAKQAEDQILYLKGEVEAWYDRSMERASGVYKRNAKGFSILIGVVPNV